MGKQRVAWWEAGWVFLLSRVTILVITFVGVSAFPQFGEAVPHNCGGDIGFCLRSWWHWDVVHFVAIAHDGYRDIFNTAFFPLWPLLIHVVGAVFSGSAAADYAASLLLANVCFYLALVLLYRLVSEDFDATVARTTLFYMALAPYALYFFAGYTESLFLLLCLAIFVLLRRGKVVDWWLAGVCGFLVVLTRATGVVLVVPFLVYFVQRYWPLWPVLRTEWRGMLVRALPVVLMPLGLLTYMLYLGITKGDPLLFQKVESAGWYRHLALPWEGIVAACWALLTGHMTFYIGDVLFTLAPLLVLAIGWRQLPVVYRWFALGLVLFVLCNPTGGPAPPLASAPRYLQVVFPIFVLCALWSKQPRVASALKVLCLPFFVIHILLFICNNWLA